MAVGWASKLGPLLAPEVKIVASLVLLSSQLESKDLKLNLESCGLWEIGLGLASILVILAVRNLLRFGDWLDILAEGFLLGLRDTVLTSSIMLLNVFFHKLLSYLCFLNVPSSSVAASEFGFFLRLFSCSTEVMFFVLVLGKFSLISTPTVMLALGLVWAVGFSLLAFFLADLVIPKSINLIVLNSLFLSLTSSCQIFCAFLGLILVVPAGSVLCWWGVGKLGKL